MKNVRIFRIPVRRASGMIYSRERCREQRWTLWPVAYFAAFQLKSVQNYRKLNKLPPQMLKYVNERL